MLQKVYDKCLKWAAHPHAIWYLAILSFAESSLFPIPVEAMMLPMMFAAPKQSFKIAGVATITSVLGGIAGYGIGLFLFDQLGQPILAFYGYEQKFVSFQETFAEWGWWIVFAGGFTPLPYKVITIAAGLAHLDLTVFILASLVSRGSRFYLEASLIYFFGPAIRQFVEKRLALVTSLGFILLLGGFLLIKALH